MNSKRFTLTGTGNDGFRYNYRIIKEESFKKIFPKFMNLLGFDKTKIIDKYYSILSQ